VVVDAAFNAQRHADAEVVDQIGADKVKRDGAALAVVDGILARQVDLDR
jgi:hypothetical protein